MKRMNSFLITLLKNGKKKGFIYTFFFLLAVFALVASFTSAKGEAGVSECRLMQEFDHAISPEKMSSFEKSHEGNIARIEHLKQIATISKGLVGRIYDSYFANTLPDNFFKICLPMKKKYRKLYRKLSAYFLMRSIERLKTSKVIALNMLAKKIEDEIEERGAFFFRTISHYAERKGGLHRVKGSIFLNLGKIPPNEWMIIFIHELMHKFDILLNESVRKYSNVELIGEIINWSQSVSSPEMLSKEQQELLYSHLIHGLNRGLLAEFRAWAVTIHLYRQLKMKKECRPVVWLEEILEQKKTSENYLAFIFRYLENPPGDQDIFHWDLAQNALNILRKRLLALENGPPIGEGLSVFID